MSQQGLQMLHGREVYVTGHGQVLDCIHDKARCAGRPCVIHAPIQGQAWSDWPTLWRSDWGGFMERVCPCGVGHPAAEDVLRGMDGSGVHGCCGCPCRIPDHLVVGFEEKGEGVEFDAASMSERRDRVDAWAQEQENKERRFKEALLGQRKPAEPDAESLAAEVAQADMQAKIYALREHLRVLTQAAKLGFEAGFPADSPFQASLAGQIHQAVEEAGSKAVAGVLTSLFWELNDRG